MKLVYVRGLFWEVRNKNDVVLGGFKIFRTQVAVEDEARIWGSMFIPPITLDIVGLEEFVAYINKQEKEFVHKNGRLS